MYSCLLLGNSITFMVWGQGGAMEHMSKGNEAETSLFAMYNCTVFSFSLYKVIKLVCFFLLMINYLITNNDAIPMSQIA